MSARVAPVTERGIRHRARVRFFTEQCGNAVEGRRLARAEREALLQGITFVWGVDTYGSAESEGKCDSECRKGDVRHDHALWECYATHPLSRYASTTLGSLSGIDFGPGGEPHGDPYKRVVEAELALGALIDLKTLRGRV